MKLVKDLKVGDVVQHVTSNGYHFEPLLLLERANNRFRWASLNDGTVQWEEYDQSQLDTPLNVSLRKLGGGVIELLAEGT